MLLPDAADTLRFFDYAFAMIFPSPFSMSPLRCRRIAVCHVAMFRCRRYAAAAMPLSLIFADCAMFFALLPRHCRQLLMLFFSLFSDAGCCYFSAALLLMLACRLLIADEAAALRLSLLAAAFRYAISRLIFAFSRLFAPMLPPLLLTISR